MAEDTNCGCSVAELADNVKSLKAISIVLSVHADSRAEYREDITEIKKELSYLQKKLNVMLRGP